VNFLQVWTQERGRWVADLMRGAVLLPALFCCDSIKQGKRAREER